MKKFLTAIIMFMFAVSTCHAETPANVCNLNVYQFYRNYNNILELAEKPDKFAIDRARMITLPDNDGYLLPLKSYKKGKGTTVGVMVDGDNISTIEIVNNKKSHRENMMMAFVMTMTLIGVDSDNLKSLMDELRPMSDGKVAVQYVESIGKYVRVECSGGDIDKGVGSLLIDAYTE